MPDVTYLPQEQAAKTNMHLVVRSMYLLLCTIEDGVGNTMEMTDHVP